MYCLHQGQVYLHQYGFNIEVDEYPYSIKSGRYPPCPAAPFVRSIAGKKPLYLHENRIYKCGVDEAEIQNYARLGSHRNFLEAYGVLDTSDGPCLILSWLPNSTTLENLLIHNTKAVDFKEIGSQFVQAIEYLHSRGICHGDIVPENILWDYDQQRVVVIDLESDEHDPECFEDDNGRVNWILKRLG